MNDPCPENFSGAPSDNDTRIDLHARFAFMGLLLGGVTSGAYYMFFRELGWAAYGWKSALYLQVGASLLLLLHHRLNRDARRMWVEGFASMLVFVPLLMIAVAGLFYFAWAPMQNWVRVAVLVPCFLTLVRHISCVWDDYSRAAKTDAVVKAIYREKGDVYIFWGAADAFIGTLTSRTPFKRVHLWMISAFGPFVAVFGMNANHLFNICNGINIFFWVVAFLGFPLTQWILGNAFVALAFFHVYLPLKLERETGKKVILGP